MPIRVATKKFFVDALQSLHIHDGDAPYVGVQLDFLIELSSQMEVGK